MGLGFTLALPLLDSMIPAGTALVKTAAQPKSRFCGIYIPHGATMDKWTPATEGSGFAFTETLKPLEKLRDRLVMCSNLAHPMAGGKGSDAGADHARSAAVFLSGAHPEKGTVHGGKTIDQLLADHIGQDTPLPSIEVCIEEVALNCGAGYGCAYYNTISWRNDTLPLPMENSPQVVFERLFGDGSNAALRLSRKQQDKSILDAVTDKVSRHIVGYHCGDSLESVGCQAALKMALQQLSPGQQPIHHSDRGSQYCCHDYVALAAARGLTMSMTEVDHCAENALAERMNGILKGEYGLDQQFKTKAQTTHAVDQAIHLYGTRRPHTALGNRFPAQVHGTFLPPAPPSCGLPGHWDPGARPELRTGVRSPAQVGATPVTDQPVEPLRGH